MTETLFFKKAHILKFLEDKMAPSAYAAAIGKMWDCEWIAAGVIEDLLIDTYYNFLMDNLPTYAIADLIACGVSEHKILIA